MATENETLFKVNYVDLLNEKIFPAEIGISGGKIKSITPIQERVSTYLMPGFIDAHVHIESSMVIPQAFAQEAVVHGTIATVSDPHEIANVCGTEGIDFMLSDAAKTPFNFYFGVPSCVPATPFENAGAVLGSKEVAELLKKPELGYLAEMMNFPGLIADDPEVLGKVKAARQNHKPIDGHAPGLSGKALQKYIAAGISTEHEATTFEEGREKMKAGMKVLIREGSAAKNFDALIPLMADAPEDALMFCSDDKHPDDLSKGHINLLVKRALAKGFPLFKVLKAACVNPVMHYGLDCGLARVNEPANFIILDNLEEMKPKATYLNGRKVAEGGKSLLEVHFPPTINHFKSNEAQLDLDLPIPAECHYANVIQAIDGAIVTGAEVVAIKQSGSFQSDTERDFLKIVVVNRYEKQKKPNVALINGFGLKEGAIASSVAHDSHHIVAVGTKDEDLKACIKAIQAEKGGLSIAHQGSVEVMPLPYAGLMSAKSVAEAGLGYEKLTQKVKNELSCKLAAPFMTLSFMALPVIPKLKITDDFLFDVEKFKPVGVFVSTKRENA